MDKKPAVQDYLGIPVDIDSLSPCPFCGVDGYDLFTMEGEFGIYVICKMCGAHGPERYSPADAGIAWNQRYDHPEKDDTRQLVKLHKIVWE